ncbi:MAG: glycosyltransferase family 1 protein [Sphingomonas bacterium]|uniref:glycosyltransferase n=1 Tax=Sphingomonas bacterium TaxID=1895847 RepID=UPI002612D48A|nr:glycosyltransferase [Sphingomonas bacterium]MDB5694870.1 glycosyltransferase family 1 protein [Sphingomonas bacterium]
MKIDIWHNVLWSRYKGRVFSALHRKAQASGDLVHFVQMAETDGNRVGLGAVDLDYHRYPFELLYRGALNAIPRWRSVPYFFWRGLTGRADFTIIAGYASAQDWAQLLGLVLQGRPRGVFCDSTLGESRPGRLRAGLKRFFFRRCDLIFCYGERAQAMALHFGARPEALVTRCQAAALPDDYNAAVIPELRAHLRSPSPSFLYVGRLAPEKNLSRLLSAFARFVVEQPSARLRLVGAGPLQLQLVREAEALGITDRLAFVGGLDQHALADEYLAATALILPSLREPWGLVVNEALAYGCPVLVSDRCGCLPELVRPGLSGLAFDPLNEAALRDGMAALAGEDSPSAVSCLSVITPFTPDAAAADILDAIHRLRGC